MRRIKDTIGQEESAYIDNLSEDLRRLLFLTLKKYGHFILIYKATSS